ncbi:hypothetical protein [Minwuia thermotolerans]|uniref:PEGA domain-containing protein n=2 Tax=Minwuia thermotolerans TaxID=2056226 RepID=A0A2M9FZM9_9PROT|nr:hypothetical protein [Minwuia thermotolerans]PJK28922.1 hypothetical protein CVT23_14955 [Minwuia thermotolerans]
MGSTGGTLQRGLLGAGRAVVIGILLLTGACASIVEGSSQTVTVTTDPSGAICELTRDGEVVGVVNPTPGSLVLGKSKDNVSVICEKEGYQNAAGSLPSEFKGMTFGNIIFGGIIGVAVDAGTGAMNEYPSQVVVRMTPEEFPSAAARDRHFDRLAEIVRKEAEVATGKIERECDKSQDDGATCREAIEAIRKQRDTRLGELELERVQARLAGA